MKNEELCKNIVCNGEIIDCSAPKVMAIINVTPDSFYQTSRAQTDAQILQKVRDAVAQGADIIDIGGYSTRSNANEVSVQEECDRVCNALKLIRQEFENIIISIDSFRSEVIYAANKFRIDMINDVSAFEFDEKMLDCIVDLQLPYILMHSKGTPQTMANMAQYKELTSDILKFFAAKIEILRANGFNKEIIIDPGFGFAKTAEQNFELLKNLHTFECFSAPILVGLSRKSMIYKTLDITPEESLCGTCALNLIALKQGGNILRVHDVKEAVQTIKLYKALNKKP